MYFNSSVFTYLPTYLILICVATTEVNECTCEVTGRVSGISWMIFVSLDVDVRIRDMLSDSYPILSPCPALEADVSFLCRFLCSTTALQLCSSALDMHVWTTYHVCSVQSDPCT